MIETRDGGFYCKVILDSMAPCQKRLTTVEIRYPRFIHSEIMTHRDRARNAASSRAIPFPAMCERIDANPVVPLKWGMEQGGMQTGDEIPEKMRPLAKQIWLEACADAMKHARRLHNIGASYAAIFTDSRTNGDLEIKVHKSIPNRIVEPWMWITVVMTATEWANFFRLRCHSDAEIHFQKIAGLIRDALGQSTPELLSDGLWHRPYLTHDERPENEPLRRIKFADYYNKISAARCARVSYLTQDGVRDQKKDIDLFNRLSNGSGFGHWSPMEHVAKALAEAERSGPFIGWKQFRKEFSLENQEG